MDPIGILCIVLEVLDVQNGQNHVFLNKEVLVILLMAEFLHHLGGMKHYK